LIQVFQFQVNVVAYDLLNMHACISHYVRCQIPPPTVREHHRSNQDQEQRAPGLVAQRQMQGFLVSITWVRALACMLITLVMSYLSAGLAGCSVGPGISCGARKLVRTPRVTKKKKKIKNKEAATGDIKDNM